MRNISQIILLIVIALAVLVLASTCHAGEFLDSGKKVSQSRLWNDVQQWRQSSRLSTYVESPYLCKMATIRSEEIKKDWSHNGYWSHNGFLTTGIYNTGENLAKGYNSEGTILASWLRSKGHRENLDRNYQLSCIRCSESYCVQLFANS